MIMSESWYIPGMDLSDLRAIANNNRKSRRAETASLSEQQRNQWRDAANSSFQSDGYEGTTGLYRVRNAAGGTRLVELATAAGPGLGQNLQVTAAGARQSWADLMFGSGTGGGSIGSGMSNGPSAPSLNGGNAGSGLDFPGVGSVQTQFGGFAGGGSFGSFGSFSGAGSGASQGPGSDRFGQDEQGRCQRQGNDRNSSPRQRDSVRIPETPTPGSTFSYSGSSNGTSFGGSSTSSGDSFADAQGIAAGINASAGSSGVRASARNTTGGATVDVECDSCMFDGAPGDDLTPGSSARSFANSRDCEDDARDQLGSGFICVGGVCIPTEVGEGIYNTMEDCQAALVFPFPGGQVPGEVYTINATATRHSWVGSTCLNNPGPTTDSDNTLVGPISSIEIQDRGNGANPCGIQGQQIRVEHAGGISLIQFGSGSVAFNNVAFTGPTRNDGTSEADDLIEGGSPPPECP